jgi:hypothetical protein
VLTASRIGEAAMNLQKELRHRSEDIDDPVLLDVVIRRDRFHIGQSLPGNEQPQTSADLFERVSSFPPRFRYKPGLIQRRRSAAASPRDGKAAIQAFRIARLH